MLFAIIDYLVICCLFCHYLVIWCEESIVDNKGRYCNKDCRRCECSSSVPIRGVTCVAVVCSSRVWEISVVPGDLATTTPNPGSMAATESDFEDHLAKEPTEYSQAEVSYNNCTYTSFTYSLHFKSISVLLIIT